MQLKKVIPLFALVISINSLSFAATPPTEEQKKESAKISEAFGHLMAKHIEEMGMNFDIQYVIKGLKNATDGQTSPMTETECIEAIAAAQEEAFKEQSNQNLVDAELFLQKNQSQEGFVALEEGKVLYKVSQEGTGAPITLESTPLVRFSGQLLNGQVFGASTEDDLLPMEELIPGLQAGMNGMKEGEKRTIYIHPELGYGTKGTLPPNSLLTFEIEIVRAESLLPIDSPELPISNEIALPGEAPLEAVR